MSRISEVLIASRKFITTLCIGMEHSTEPHISIMPQSTKYVLSNRCLSSLRYTISLVLLALAAKPPNLQRFLCRYSTVKTASAKDTRTPSNVPSE